MYSELEKIIFEKYIHELRGTAFKVFLKLIWIAREKHEVKVRSERMLRRMFCIYSNSEQHWDELINNAFVVKKTKRDRSIYSLNYKKLKQDSGQILKLEVIVFKTIEIGTNEVADVNDDIIIKMIKATKFDNHLVPEIFKLIMNLKKYHVTKGKWFLLKDVKRVLFILVKYDSRVIYETCLRFNTSPKISGQRGVRYFVRTIEGINSEYKNVKPIENEKDLIVENKTNQHKSEAEKKFAVKVATGQIKNNLIYKRLLNDDKELNKIWNVGADELKKENRENEIFYNYEWLKLKNKKV